MKTSPDTGRITKILGWNDFYITNDKQDRAVVVVVDSSLETPLE